MKRSVSRKYLKLIGLLLCLMTLAFWVFSVTFVAYYATPSGPWSIGIAFGRFGFENSQGADPGWVCIPMYSQLKSRAQEMPWTEFAQSRLGFAMPGRGRTGMFHIPVWLLVVAVGFPTAVLWWRDRRSKVGFCKSCKYDLTGNVSGTCPECGTAVVDASKNTGKRRTNGV